MNRENPEATLGPAALAEMHRRSEQLGEDPLRPERAIEIVQPPPAGARDLVIQEPNWELERLERLEAERAARVAEASAVLEADRPPERPTAPAAKQRKSWRRTTA